MMERGVDTIGILCALLNCVIVDRGRVGRPVLGKEHKYLCKVLEG